MSHFYFYSDNPASSGGVSTKRMNPTKHYAKHFRIAMELTRIARTLTDARDKHQVMKELTIAERKMTWWERHKDFCWADVKAAIAEVKAERAI